MRNKRAYRWSGFLRGLHHGYIVMRIKIEYTAQEEYKGFLLLPSFGSRGNLYVQFRTIDPGALRL